MNDITLTPHQQEAMQWLVTQVQEGHPLMALRGYAGSGKTTLIPHLRTALREMGMSSVVGAPTHRAAMVLRRKGISEANTVHAHALTPYFTVDYARAAVWFGAEPLPRKPGTMEEPKPDIDGVPWLIATMLGTDVARAHDKRRLRGAVTAKKLLGSLGIHGKDYFAGFGPKLGQGVLILDEASMVGQGMLTLCQQAFRQVCLVGDPGQLPPVKDVAMLAQVPGVDLTEIHRQASESPILRLATRARHGEPFWTAVQQHQFPTTGEGVVIAQQADAAQFLDAPLLVWRNDTRRRCTVDIRTALGYPAHALVAGEPLVCRSTSQEDRAEGFYNNGLYRIVEVDSADPRMLVVADALGEELEVCAHLEELDGSAIPHQAVPFRFGYCLTAHTAQGGEWPTVYISMPDLLAYVGFCTRRGQDQERAQWTYTALTRAKTTVVFLTDHHFLQQYERTPMATPRKDTAVKPDETIAPPSAPMMTEIPPSPLDPPDDIPQVTVPPATVEAVTPQPEPTLPETLRPFEPLMQGFLQVVQRHLKAQMDEYHSDLKSRIGAIDTEHLRLCATLETVTKLAQQSVSKAGETNEHAQYQLSEALCKLQEQGLALRHDPYTLRVQAVAPHGYPVEFQVTKTSVQDLITALPALLGWLHEQQFTAPETVGV